MPFFAIAYLREYPITSSGFLSLVEAAMTAAVANCGNGMNDAGEFAVPIFVTSAYLLVAAEIFLIGFLCGKCVSPSPENVHFLEDFKVNHKGFLFFQKFKKFYVLFGVFVGTVQY